MNSLKQSLIGISFAKFLLGGIFLFGLLEMANAQMDHSSHIGGSVAKPVTCLGSGLECANAATPFFTADGKLLLSWSANGVVSVAQSTDFG